MADDHLQRRDYLTLARHAGWSYVAVVGSVATTLLTAALLVRAVGADDFGVYAVVMSMVAIVVSLEGILNIGVVRAIRADDADTGGFIRSSMRAHQLAASATAIIGMTIAAAAWMQSWQSAVLVAGATLGAALILLTATSNAVLVASERFRAIGLSMAAGGAVQVAVVWLLRDDLGVAAGGLAVLAGAAVARIPQVRSAGPAHRTFAAGSSPHLHRNVLRFAWPVAIVGLSPHLVNFVDLVALTTIHGAATAGLYRLGSVLPGQALNAFFRGYDVIYPRLSDATRDPQQLLMSVNRIAAAVAGFGLGGVAGAHDVVTALMLGSRSRITSAAVVGFSVVALLNVPAHGLSLLAISRNSHRPLARVVGAETLVNVVLTVALVRLHGFLGAIAATIISVGVSNVVMVPRVVARALPRLRVIRYMIEGLLIGAAAWCAGYWLASIATDLMLT